MSQLHAESDAVLGVAAYDVMPEGQQQQAPSAGDNNDDAPEADKAPPSYDLWPPEPDFSPTGFDAGQMKQLYLQLSHHCQLMIEVCALTACSTVHQGVAATLFDLLAQYQVRHCTALAHRSALQALNNCRDGVLFYAATDSLDITLHLSVSSMVAACHIWQQANSTAIMSVHMHTVCAIILVCTSAIISWMLLLEVMERSSHNKHFAAIQ